MTAETAHPMLPAANHDETAQQRFVLALKQHVSANVTAGNHAVYNHRVLPAFTRQEGRAPRNRHEVRRWMEREPYHQMWGSLMRLGQELMWDYILESVDRQLDDLVDRSAPKKGAGGSLRLDPAFEQPRYLALVDQHGQPGSYYTDTRAGDVRAGAILDQGAAIYHFGKAGGAMVDARGRTLVQHVYDVYPDLDPRRILDLGCCVGAGTLPLAQFFPKAQVHAIDTGAPILRYAHARAEHLGQRVHFAQQSAEDLDYPDGHFDLVTSMVVLHETSTAALPRIFSECLRVLRPGGVMIHLEVPVRYPDMDSLCEQVLRDWQTYYNDEPFWGRVCETDLVALARQTGFVDAVQGYQKQTLAPQRGDLGWPVPPTSRPGHWYIVSARKPVG